VLYARASMKPVGTICCGSRWLEVWGKGFAQEKTATGKPVAVEVCCSIV
jgi:hypothetical protein